MNWKSYRKRPVLVQAIQWDGTDIEFPEECRIGKKDKDGTIVGNKTGVIGVSGGELLILTTEGLMGGLPGCWVVKGTEIYIVKDSIFRTVYEEIE